MLFGGTSRRTNQGAGAGGLPQSRANSSRAGIKAIGGDRGSLQDLQSRRSQEPAKATGQDPEDFLKGSYRKK